MATLSPSLQSALWGCGVQVRLTPKNGGMCCPRRGLVVEAKKQIEGKVVCASNDKTASVEVTRLVVDPKSRRRVKRTKNYHAHDPDNACKLGDIVTLDMSRPYSKTKRFIVSAIKPKVSGRVVKDAELPPMQSLVKSQEESPGKLEPGEAPAEEPAVVS